jgi:hypothetical protein
MRILALFFLFVGFNAFGISDHDLYLQAKKSFQTSAFCDPLKLTNSPDEKLSPFLMAKLLSDLKDDNVKALLIRYNVSENIQSEVLALLADSGKEILLRVKGLILQDIVAHFVPNSDDIKIELLKNHIFNLNKNEIECPFLGEDAFTKGVSGRAKVLGKIGAGVTQKDLLTIVDYTRPSNERRLFVINMVSFEVLHNTWVAHGRGGKAEGIDGLGSSPVVSNILGSLMSSEGFVLAGEKAVGDLYGNNVLLKGIDNNNSNMTARAIVLHGWESPASPYILLDPTKKMMAVDFRKASLKVMEATFEDIRSSVMIPSYLKATDGCLGVPVIPMKHLDLKGRNKNQLELLREDLPGSIIFNYAGPGTKSQFLN